jgi:tripartite-type tricarboxylate transporter receptor subunit TctC
MRKTVFAAAIAAALSAAASSAWAAFPDRPVKMVVPWAAGGDTDVIYRAFQPFFQKALGATVVIANVGGASGAKGAKEAQDSPGDGYTILALHDSIHLTYYTGVADVAYSDFQPVCLVTATPSILTVSPKTPWKDFKSLIADSKANPGKFTVGASLGSTSQFFPAMIEKATGVKWRYVPYDGTAKRMNALLGGHVDIAESNMTQKGKVDAGEMKFLAYAWDKRSPDMPDLPTLKELGIDIVYALSRGLVAPKGTPPDVMAKLESACATAAKDPAFADAMKLQGTVVQFRDGKGYAEFLKRNDVENRDLVKELGMSKR